MVDGQKFIIIAGGDLPLNWHYGGLATHTGVTFHTVLPGTLIPLIHFLHETGHLLDYSKNNGFSNPLTTAPTWVKDGFVNKELLGKQFNQQYKLCRLKLMI